MDWSMIVLVFGFLLAVPWPVFLSTLLPDLKFAWARPFAAYEEALRAAAIKSPSDRRGLRTLETSQVRLFNLRNNPLPTGENVTLKSAVWAALPEELHAACADAEDPLLRLQQVLGLPRRSGQFSIYPITVNSQDVVRPCMSGDRPISPTCGFELPEDPTAKSAADEQPQEAYDRLRKAYEQLRFVAGQMWNVYRTGFPDQWAAKDDYPYTGYPFTGMGWSYDWSPASATHVGVTEFVIPKNTTVAIDGPQELAAFCKSK
jgi:hypothetical protein